MRIKFNSITGCQGIEVGVLGWGSSYTNSGISLAVRSSGSDSWPLLQEARVPSLGEELRSYKPCGTAEKKKNFFFSYDAILIPSTSECDLIWRSGLQRCDQVKMRWLVVALIQYDWCPYKKERSRHRDTHGGEHHEHEIGPRQAKGDNRNRSFLHSPQKEPVLLTPQL